MEKTTLLLREDVKEALINKFGKRKLSKVINEILFREVVKKKKDMFGADPWLKKVGSKDLREHHDRL